MCSENDLIKVIFYYLCLLLTIHRQWKPSKHIYKIINIWYLVITLFAGYSKTKWVKGEKKPMHFCCDCLSFSNMPMLTSQYSKNQFHRSIIILKQENDYLTLMGTDCYMLNTTIASPKLETGTSISWPQYFTIMKNFTIMNNNYCSLQFWIQLFVSSKKFKY